MTDGDEDGIVEAVILDYLPHGRVDDDRPQYQKATLAYAVTVEDFRLFELELADDADVGIADRVVIAPTSERDAVERLIMVEYGDLSRGARSELEYAVDEIIDADEMRFVSYYNDAGPITLRLHQLDLLPGIGQKLRDAILDGRKRRPFESFDDIEARISGLHDPKGVLIDRILEEIQGTDHKYRLFVGEDALSLRI